MILDFDGTITKPFFDWPSMKREMGLTEDVGILSFLTTAPPHEAKRVAEVLDRHEAEAARRCQLNEGVLPLLGYLKREAIAHALVTNNTRKYVDQMLLRMGLEFEVIITRDVGHWKPSAVPILLAAEGLGLPPESMAVIGDGHFDMMAGREAGCLTICLTHTHRPECDHLIETLEDAVGILRSYRAEESRS